MVKVPHIVIIGAGLIGLSTADSLAQRGARVTVVDRNEGPGQGASFNNSGMIHPSQAAPWLEGDFEDETRAVLDLGRLSKELLGARMRSLGLSCAGRTPGCVQLFDSVYLGEQAAEHYERLGVACENITGEGHTFGRYALLFSGDLSGNAHAYCKALEADLKRRGVEFTYSAKDIPAANHTVIAAGTGSKAVAAKFDVALPIIPLRGHALNFSKPDVSLPGTPLMHHASRSAMTVFEDHVRLSGTVAEDGPEVLLEVWGEIAPDIIPALGAPLLSWSEDRPVCTLGRPVIAQIKPGVWVNSGHGHMGWTLSAGSGELMARMILEGHVDERFGLNRYSG